jgi:hypothetical protein
LRGVFTVLRAAMPGRKIESWMHRMDRNSVAKRGPKGNSDVHPPELPASLIRAAIRPAFGPSARCE